MVHKPVGIGKDSDNIFIIVFYGNTNGNRQGFISHNEFKHL